MRARKIRVEQCDHCPQCLNCGKDGLFCDAAPFFDDGSVQ